MENVGGCETHTERQSVLRSPGGGEMVTVNSPRDPPCSSCGLRKVQEPGGTLRDLLT